METVRNYMKIIINQFSFDLKWDSKLLNRCYENIYRRIELFDSKYKIFENTCKNNIIIKLASYYGVMLNKEC